MQFLLMYIQFVCAASVYDATIQFYVVVYIVAAEIVGFYIDGSATEAIQKHSSM